MTILLPDEGRFREFEDEIDATLVDGGLDDIEDQNVLLTMPKFEFESQFTAILRGFRSSRYRPSYEARQRSPQPPRWGSCSYVLAWCGKRLRHGK